MTSFLSHGILLLHYSGNLKLLHTFESVMVGIGGGGNRLSILFVARSRIDESSKKQIHPRFPVDQKLCCALIESTFFLFDLTLLLALCSTL